MEDKYAELLVKTYRKKMEDKMVKLEKYQEDLQSVSLIPQTSLLMNDNTSNNSIDLSLSNNNNSEEENVDESLAQDQEQRNLLTGKKMSSRRNLKYSYHVLKRRMSFSK